MSARSVDGYPREPGVQKADQGPWGSQTYAQNSLTQLEDAVNDTEAMFDRSTRVWPDLADPCSQKNRSPTPTNDFNELGKANAESVITKRNYDDPSQAALLSTFNDVNQKLELKETSAESPVERRSDKNGKWPNEQVTAPSKMAKNQAERKDALKVKAEQFSEALSLDIVKRVNEGSIGEIKSIIKTEFLSLFNPIKTLKRSNDEISSSATISDRKRRQVTCEHCSKTMVRSCDLKYVFHRLFPVRPDRTEGVTESIASVIPVHTAVHSRRAPKCLEARMTGSDMKTRSIITWQRGDVSRPVLTRSNNAPRCFIAESSFRPTSENPIRSKAKKRFASGPNVIKWEETAKQDFGAGSARRLSNSTNKGWRRGMSDSIISTIVISRTGRPLTTGIRWIKTYPRDF